MVVDAEQSQRRELFGRFVTTSSVGIEIGPSYRPTFPKAEGWHVLSVDHLATPQLIEKFCKDTGVPREFLDRIEEVDLVWQGEPYRQIAGMPSNLDFVVACHVIEHSPDLIGWLNDCSSILRPGGHLLLAVPSRRLTFDHYRPLTTLGDVMAARLSPEIYEAKAWIDQSYLASAIDGATSWVPETLRDVRMNGGAPLPIRAESEITDLLKQLTEGVKSGAPYRDGHRWVFEKESLADIIGHLSASGLIEFCVEEYATGAGCEFLMVLTRTSETRDRLPNSRSTVLPQLSPPIIPGDPDDAVGMLRAELDELHATNADLRERVRTMNMTAETLHARIEAMKSSTSWKFTAPLRRLSRRLTSMRAHLRRR